MFLIFRQSEPQRSCKQGSYIKKACKTNQIHFIGTKTFQNLPENKNILSKVWGSNDPQNKNLEPQKKFRRSYKKKACIVKRQVRSNKDASKKILF